MLLLQAKMFTMKKYNCEQMRPHTLPCVSAWGVRLYGKMLTSPNQSKTVSNFLSEVSKNCRRCAQSLKPLEKHISKKGPEREIKRGKPPVKTRICQIYREPPNSLCLINRAMEIASSVLCRLLISLLLPTGFVCFL